MNHPSELPPPDPSPDRQLRQDIACNIVMTLNETLPPPSVDTPEAWALRNRLAVARVNALAPATIEESDVAAHYIACQAHASDCLRLSAQRGADAKSVAQQRAQQASMGREVRGYRGLLTRLQAARCKAAASDRAWRGRGVAAADEPARRMAAADEPAPEMAELITQALATLSPMPPPAPAPEAAASPADPVHPRPLAFSDLTEQEQQRERLRSEADRYAICHTVRVKLIRQLGGLPPDCDYEPPRPEILDLIINGQTSNLIWADAYQPWVAPPPPA
jgi:hypothetical protein